jgi:curved DNA-binding protein CbpA
VLFRSVYNSAQNRQSGNPQAIPATQGGFAGKVIQFLLEKVLRIQIPQRGKDWLDVLKVTPEVALQGGEVKYYYRKSDKPRDLMIKIPVGIKKGQQIRLREMGSPGKAGGPPGDLLLKVSIKISLLQRVKALLGI